MVGPVDGHMLDGDANPTRIGALVTEDAFPTIKYLDYRTFMTSCSCLLYKNVTLCTDISQAGSLLRA